MSRTEIGRDLIEPVSMFARLLHAGSTLHAATNEVAQRHPHSLFHRIAIAVQHGSPYAEAVASVRPRDDDERLALFVLELAAQVGGDTPAQIDSLLDTLGTRRNARSERLAHASAALASTRLLTIVPFIALMFIVVSDRRMVHTYLGSTAGLACLVGGIVLNAVGRLWTRRMIGRP